MRTATRSVTRAAAPAAVAVDDDVLLDQLLASLHVTLRQLLNVDPATLSDEQHEEWRKQVNSVNLAISKVRNARLEALNAELSAELPALQQSADRLTKSLADLRTANEVIGAVAAGLGVITQILKLFA